MMSSQPSENSKEGKRKEKKKRKATSKHLEDEEKHHKNKKPKYSPSMWTSSSSESEYDCLYLENQLYVSKLPRNATEKDVSEFFNGKTADIEICDVLTEKNEFIDRRAGVSFASRSATKEGLKLNGKLMRGKPIFVARRGNSREIICVSGFNNQVAVGVIKKELRLKFRQRGKLLNIFLPVDNSTGSSLGFGYIYIDLITKKDRKDPYKDLIRYTKIGGVPVDIRRATPKLCYQAEIEGKQQPVLEKGSDEEKKIALKKMLLPIPANLHNSGKHHKRFSWRKDKPDLIPETPVQTASECWAIGLQRGHSASCKQAGIDGPIPTSDEIVKGVDAAYQVSEEGIRRLKHAATFMQKYCKEMVVHRRPRGNDVALFEEFERFVIDISSNVPVMVTIECPPGFQSFKGQGMYRPTDIDCYLRTFEKFPIHCLFLTGNDIDENGIEFFQLQGSWGKDYGDDEGFIRMERHKCLIKSVVVFKH